MRRRAVSVRQPYAELIAMGRKTIECRTWPLRPGPLIICSSKQWAQGGVERWGKLGHRGVTVCEVELVVCGPLDLSDSLAACCQLGPLDCQGGYAWELRLIRRLDPVPVRGGAKVFYVTA